MGSRFPDPDPTPTEEQMAFVRSLTADQVEAIAVVAHRAWGNAGTYSVSGWRNGLSCAVDHANGEPAYDDRPHGQGRG